MSDLRTKAKTLIGALGGSTLPYKRALKSLSERELINLESKIGSQLFGTIPKGVRREFFNLNPKTWIWHEEWVRSGTKKMESRTIKYEVHEDHVLKVQEGLSYVKVEGKELEDFSLATQIYFERTMRQIYNRDPQTGKKLQ